MKDTKKKIAIVPGSFDPITYGHIELVRQALENYDLVYLAVMINPAKEYLFTMEERTAIAKAALSGFERVEVIASEDMLWKLAENLCATGIVKGYRNESDLAYEREMAAFNLAHNPNAPTELLPSPASLVDISSTIVRERLRGGQSLDDFLPREAISVIETIISALGAF